MRRTRRPSLVGWGAAVVVVCLTPVTAGCSDDERSSDGPPAPTGPGSVSVVTALDSSDADRLTVSFTEPDVGARSEIVLTISALGGGEVELAVERGWCRLDGSTVVPTGVDEIPFEGEGCAVRALAVASGAEESVSITWRPHTVRGTWETPVLVDEGGDGRRHRVTFRADDRLYRLRYGTGCSGPRYVGGGETVEIVATGSGTVCEVNGVPIRIGPSTYAIADTLSFAT